MTDTSPAILIVEDDEWFAEQQKRLLERENYQVLIAPHPFAAIEMIDQSTPHVIILDIFLAGSNGFSLLHELRSHADLARIPVILCSANATDLAQEDMSIYGIQSILDKTTMHPADLVAAVKKVLL